MAYGIRMELWGEYALFSRPELKVERYSYECITPSAARGALESVFWHPGLQYTIDRIHVLNEIKFTTVRRNEVKSKASSSLLRSALTSDAALPHIDAGTDIVQRASVMLRDVHYVIDAHFVMTEKANEGDNPGKFKDMLRRRLEKGKCYSQPYLGTRECACSFGLWQDEGDPVGFYSDGGERDFGLMLYDMDYSDPQNIVPMFFHAEMKNGVVEVPPESEVFR